MTSMPGGGVVVVVVEVVGLGVNAKDCPFTYQALFSCVNSSSFVVCL